jgi:hypothetical protein
MESLARVGLISRGTVYFLIGGLALLMAAGDKHGEATDMKGVLTNLLSKPLGTFLLSLMALGFFCYAIWRAIQAVTDSDNWGSGWQGVMMRTGQAGGALSHLGLGAYAFGLIFFFKSTRGPRAEKQVARFLFKLPLGDWLVGGLGLGILIFGIAQFVIAYREGFCRYIAFPRRGSRTLKSVCKFGLMSRGFVFMIIGGFFIKAGFKHSSNEVGGVREAWQSLQAAPYGEFLVAAVALGLIAYAFFTAVEAAYRKQA